MSKAYGEVVTDKRETAVQQEWRDLSEERLKSLESGKTQGISWDEVKQQIKG